MIPSLLLLLGLVIGCLLAGKTLIHYFQLESYQFPGYFRTLKRNWLKALLPGCCMTVFLILSLLGIGALISSRWLSCLTESLLLVLFGYVLSRLLSEKKPKKPFALTARVKRLYAVSVLVMMLILCLIAMPLFQAVTPDDGRIHARITLILLFPLFLPLWIALCGLLAWPIEKGISELYFRDAQKILRSRPDLIRIGITGSWGKTSVKFILGTLLEEKYHTLVTPASYNTPMGVTKVIRTMLEPGHRVFVSEMGARHVGDIREMCRLVHPQLGVLTSVGPQHLDTFKTVERVASTKYELIEALPEDGTAFFADDGGLCRGLYEKTAMTKFISGLDAGKDDLWAENLRYTPEGTRFDLCREGQRWECRTELLGELNVRNILLAASVAFHLDLSPEQVIRGIGKIKPVEHRLQLIHYPGGIHVVDDAFNSNIRGARQAFEILKTFPGKRVIITPGMVELGEREEELNREFGRAMDGCCDEAVLVGERRSRAIREGLASAGFPQNHIHVVSSLEEAVRWMKDNVSPGDTVLFENDLPDNYTE